MLKINEIFYSIQGESSRAGLATVFIRTTGCNLRCSYCDTQHSYYEGKKISLDEIVQNVEQYQTPYVCITGGEPLLQPKIYSLISRLCDKNFEVSLETSGDINCSLVDERVKKIIDIKTPDSGAANSFDLENLKYADVNTEFKFIICSKNDFLWAEKFIKKHELYIKSNVLYSPSHAVVSGEWLANQMLKEHSKARLQLQLHKYLWPSTQRGV